MNAPRDSTRSLDNYLNELIDFGGDLMTRADVIRTMQAEGTDQPCIDRWLQGYEHAQRIRARRSRLELKLILANAAPSSRHPRR